MAAPARRNDVGGPPVMPTWRDKVYAYITHRDRVLVFRQPQFPEAGIQVPGGSVEPGETPDEAVMREAREETGLSALTMVRFLGERPFDRRLRGRGGLDRRYFYHLRCGGEPPAVWQHAERTPSEGGPGPINFVLWWVALDEVPTLVAEMGALLPKLWELPTATGDPDAHQ